MKDQSADPHRKAAGPRPDSDAKPGSALAESEARCRATFEQAPIGIGHMAPDGRWLMVNHRLCDMVGYSTEELLQGTLQGITHPEGRDVDLAQMRRVLSGQVETSSWEKRCLHKSGASLWINVTVSLVRRQEGTPDYFVAVVQDITARKQAEAETAHERAVLEALAKGEPLPEILTRLVLAYEEMFAGTLASVLLLDADGRRVVHGAAPSLPEAYWRAIDGSEIGPAAGSCGTAAYTRRTTVVSDIATDPLWRDYKDLALTHRLRACWSVPVISSEGRVLGTFALYYREPRAPEPPELAAVERGARLAGVAIERHQLFQALSDREQRFRTLFEQASDGIFVADPQGRFLEVNSAGCQMVGYTAEELRDLTVADLVAPDELERFAPEAARLRAGGVVRSEWQFRRQDGSLVLGEITGKQLPDGRLQAFLRDITERKRAEEALGERTLQLDMALRGAHLGLWHWDFPSDAITTLKGAGPISGLPAADYPATGEAFKALVHPEDRAQVAERIQHAVESREDYEAEFRIVLPGTQDLRWVSARGRCLYDDDGHPTVLTGVDMDVTERKRVDHEIRQLNVELEQRVADRTVELNARTRELESFAYSVSHDLKAPLRGIDGYSRLLLEDHAERVNEEGRTFLHNIRQATAQMSRLIDDLLAYSRLERRPLQAMQVDLPALAQSVLGDRADELRARGVLASLEVPAMAASVDRQGLALALRNLVDNALKFTQGTPSPKIEIGGRASDVACLLWVRDNGIGFEMKFHDRIFEVFQRLQRSEHYPGTGIGLAMVRKAMERMGGRVWAESQPGQGATFFLEIPR